MDFDHTRGFWTIKSNKIINSEIMRINFYCLIFTGYGGNVIRDEVKNKSQWFVTDFQELIDNL